MPERRLASRAEIPPGRTLRVEAAGRGILLCNTGDAVTAIEDLCSHDGGELDQAELEGCRIRCPRHGALFDVRDGAALTLPAIQPIETFPVRIDGDDVFGDV